MCYKVLVLFPTNVFFIIMNSLFQIKKRVAMRVAKVSRVQLSLVGGTSRASGCSYPPRCVWARAPLWVVAGHLQAVRPEDPQSYSLGRGTSCIHIIVRGGMPA